MSLSETQDNSGPRFIGPYEITRKIGEGGMAVVYAAQQREPVRREVALKVVKQGMDSKEVIARFKAERQALVLMKHPHIAQVYSAGTTEEGSPYFAMELVHGEPLTTYCARVQMDIRTRLQLFRKICEAVQHAHQKGVIHRDLKPSNILVEEREGQHVPKIIDFGIAKSTHKQLVEETLFTEIGRLIGTPAYMSPEQLEAKSPYVDTRTDLYSLGVILYELITGRLPFDPKALLRQGLAEMQRMIQEESPRKPSTVWKREAADPKEFATGRHTGGQQIQRTLRGDLDWITLRCLEKDPNRRYQSPSELAAEIRRYLDHEPVLASPPSRIYWLRKFLRKHRVVCSVVAINFLTLCAGTGWALYERSAANELAAEEKRNLKRAELLEAAAYESRRLAEVERAKAASLAEAEKRARAEAALRAAAETAHRREAERQRELQESQTEEILRLSDAKLLEMAITDSKELWPAYPQKIPQLKAWLVNYAQPLRKRRPLHEKSLESLRSRAFPYTEDDQQRDHSTHPQADDLAALRVELKKLMLAKSQPSWEKKTPNERESFKLWIARVEKRTREIEAEISSRRTYQFSSSADEWIHEITAELVRGLARFFHEDPRLGTVASVQSRLSFASTILERSIEAKAARDAWNAALKRVASSEHYDFNERPFEPQIGLFPLGPDPDSGLEEFLHLATHSGEIPERNSAGQLPRDASLGVILVLLPGGTFRLGAQAQDPAKPNYDPMASRLEGPVVSLSLEPFLISKYEMTQAQWLRVTGNTPSHYGPSWSQAHHQNSALNPVESVSWTQCQTVLHQLGLIIPTEAQWEYAARAGSSTPWWSGAEEISIPKRKAGNVSDARSKRITGTTMAEKWEDPWIQHAPVGSLAPNAFGIHDVIGNVSEWCRDSWSALSDFTLDGESERIGPDLGNRPHRGGNWTSLGGFARSAVRGNDVVGGAFYDLGIRPARRLDHRQRERTGYPLPVAR